MSCWWITRPESRSESWFKRSENAWTRNPTKTEKSQLWPWGKGRWWWAGRWCLPSTTPPSLPTQPARHHGDGESDWLVTIVLEWVLCASRNLNLSVSRPCMPLLTETCSSTHLVAPLASAIPVTIRYRCGGNQPHYIYLSFCKSVNLTLFMHSFAIADRVSKVKAFMLVVTATHPMNLKCFFFDRLSVNDVCVVWILSTGLFPFSTFFFLQ